MNLGFDLDEVIGKTAQMAINYCNFELGTKIRLEDIGFFWFNENIFSLDEKKQKAIVNALSWAVNSGEMMETIEPYKDAVRYLNIIAKAGHKITIITKRQAEFKDMTATWLKRNNIAYDTLILTDGEDKGTFARQHNLDCYVDDYTPNLEEMATAKARWRKGLMLMTRPWNRHEWIDATTISRVGNWQEIMRNIEIGNRLK